MKKLLTTFLLLLCCILVHAEAIPLKATRGGNTNNRPRLPTRTRILADKEENRVSIRILYYTGDVIVSVYDKEGYQVMTTQTSISGSHNIQMDLDNPSIGEYFLHITLGGTTYIGTFYIMSEYYIHTDNIKLN